MQKVFSRVCFLLLYQEKYSNLNSYTLILGLISNKSITGNAARRTRSSTIPKQIQGRFVPLQCCLCTQLGFKVYFSPFSISSHLLGTPLPLGLCQGDCHTDWEPRVLRQMDTIDLQLDFPENSKPWEQVTHPWEQCKTREFLKQHVTPILSRCVTQVKQEQGLSWTDLRLQSCCCARTG